MNSIKKVNFKMPFKSNSQTTPKERCSPIRIMLLKIGLNNKLIDVFCLERNYHCAYLFS